MRTEKGFTLLEAAAALAILGILAAAFLSGIGTSFKAAGVNSRQTMAQSLAISELEYVKNCPYEPSATQYAVDGTIDVPEGYTIPPPEVDFLHGSEDGIQKVTIKVEYAGAEVFSIDTYKVDRG
jgi:prepilin-type N-terminal cleavage/methylation domain-containing protein